MSHERTSRREPGSESGLQIVQLPQRPFDVTGRSGAMLLPLSHVRVQAHHLKAKLDKMNQLLTQGDQSGQVERLQRLGREVHGLAFVLQGAALADYHLELHDRRLKVLVLLQI